MSKKKRSHSSDNPFLAQMLFRFTPATPSFLEKIDNPEIATEHRNAKEGLDYASVTNDITRATFGMSIQDLKSLKSRKCEAVTHTGKTPVNAAWEVRFYQNTERAAALHEAGIEREKIVQTLWDEACREQDTIGVIVHKTMHLCTDCITTIITNHGGKEAGFLAITTAQVKRGALLLVSDRLTEHAAIVGNLPAATTEQDLLPLLKQEGILDLRFKE